MNTYEKIVEALKHNMFIQIFYYRGYYSSFGYKIINTLTYKSVSRKYNFENYDSAVDAAYEEVINMKKEPYGSVYHTYKLTYRNMYNDQLVYEYVRTCSGINKWYYRTRNGFTTTEPLRLIARNKIKDD